MKTIITIFMFIIFIFINIYIITSCSSEIKYTLIKKGEVKKVEYLKGSFNSYEKTVITFTDNTKVVLKYHHNVLKKNIFIYERYNLTAIYVEPMIITYKEIK